MSETKKVANPSKRIVKLNAFIARILAEDGHDVPQVTLACQSAVNDVEGKEGEAKISPMKHTNKAKSHAKWRENVPVTYEVKAGNAYDFLCWHDALDEVFTKHGEPHAELTINIVPAGLIVWLAGMKKRREEKAKLTGKGKDRPAPINGPADRAGKGAPATA